MECWYCSTKLIWGGDHDIDDEEFEHMIETNLTCPRCRAFVIVFYQESNWKRNDRKGRQTSAWILLARI